MKKIISSIIILVLIFNNLVLSTYAVDTNWEASPWTIQKAEHLAKKALFWASKNKVLELYNAGSADAAVNILFPSINWPDRTAYNTKMSWLLNTDWLIEDYNLDMREYYAFKKLEDPYEAKAKLFWIFEDTFSVDTIRDRINYWDIENTHDLLYSHTLWNYKEMIKRNLYNNWNPWDYSLWEYLDLFNQTRPEYPNENYSREILQLFLMLEYKPTESEDLWSQRNYTEEDVNALAKILFWFESDENTHQVTYNTLANTNTEIEFLSWSLKTWDSFPFYNSWSGIIDIQAMKTSIWWNNWLPDNIIDYIFSKREDSIAIFLADKLYRFYVAENPTREELDLITNKIIENNFEIYPTVKWLLANDMMYSDKSMNSIIYKNPLELAIWTAKILWLNSDILDFRYMLTNLGWTPYDPGKIFWRDWYDDNSVFFTPYISNKWTSESSKLATLLIDNNLDFIQNRDTADNIINELEDKLFLWKTLDISTRNKLINYLTHDKDWNEIQIDFDNTDYIAKNIQWVIYIMLNQPEYVLQSWYDKAITSDTQNTSFYTNENKIVFIKASGWLDWLHTIIPKDEYNEYLTYRSTWALTWTWLISLNDDLYINWSMQPFVDLYNAWNLKVINRVWTPNHSRWHDSASRKITSIDDTYEWDKWIFWDLISEENPSKTIVLDGWAKPSIFRNWKYMWIWSSALYKITYWDTYINADEREYKISTLKDILQNRNYIWEFWETFKNSAVIDDVARESVANWWREWSWYNMFQRFTFLESLYNWGLWNAAWMRADWWYDNHRNEKEYLNWNLETVAKETTDFFNRVKNKYNVTIVIYSEFWRTNKLNASLWVDHWMWGWMFIISNNNELINNTLDKKTYWNQSFKNSKRNWLWVGIDYRSVYSAIFKAIFNIDISDKLWGIFNINDYVDTNKSETQLLWYNHNQVSWNTYYTHVKFNVDDINFFSSQASHLKFEYWTDNDPIREISSYTLDRSRVNEKEYDIRIRTYWTTKYYYKLTIYDNQFNEKIINWYFVTPTLEENLNPNHSVFLSRFKNIDTSNPIILNNSYTWIILSNSWTVEYLWDNDHKILVNSWTYVNEIKWNIWSTWNWIFLNPTEINPSTFIWNLAKHNWIKINQYNIKKLIKVWASSLWVWLNLNQNVTIEVNNIDTTKNYKILTSEDWIEWYVLENSNITKVWNKLQFQTNHFSYFTIVEVDSNWNFITPTSTTTEESTYIFSTSWGSVRLVKDKCEYWDFSPSYYDRTCWIDPFTIHSNSYENMYEWLKNDLESLWKSNNSNLKTEKEMEIAYIELKIQAKEKAKIYESLFTDEVIEEINKKDNSTLENQFKNIESKKEILILLREKLSIKMIWAYELVYIKNSKLNDVFEKIAKLIIKKDFDKETEKLSFENLNKVIIYYAINELENIDSQTKEKNKSLLKQSIKELIKPFQKKKTIKKIVPKKKETIKEKIMRINAKKRAMKEAQ